MITDADRATITAAMPLSLFRKAFGLKDGQTLSEFQKECASLRDDANFVEEVRAYLLAQ
jgi:hypothetical protein